MEEDRKRLVTYLHGTTKETLVVTKYKISKNYNDNAKCLY